VVSPRLKVGLAFVSFCNGHSFEKIIKLERRAKMRKGTVAATEMTTGWSLRTFTTDALDKIHAATLDVLRTTGVSMDCNEALDILYPVF
jgi:trimethylamine:corrinoid methyltransferase-like protein